ncbi:50S ribosomal protein L11 methyltransferase [Clostridium gasigenes]|uniref:[LSU ribosomal protein L11P]-lysine N-methyltransferase n=1 Tax=Clostridium gasigenes TaxID=94869 RepID=A0A1H0MHJ6_9CLOT|nr:50S ribosomal protein L11 methyltransferase [Clostridium gasigenes]MBB6622127.1 50S ribosomal protein L11 methyltransferase [Clostridium gasigenes]MBU3086966.1 50S ribosomal protein L11 methyltransferase [Clostridium gasigenes]SDO79795.1 [LSU ribosomal protein L11P]-lysine N-methyltransferase [Clostridium gasigenes]
MYVLTYKINSNELDEKIELLQINDIFNTFYETPLEITTDDFGYGYLEKENEIIDFKVSFEGESKDLEGFKTQVSTLLNSKIVNIEEINYDYSTYEFPAVHIDDNWVLAGVSEDFPNKNKICFIPQGAFGTGLHETTQDILKVLLNTLNLNDKTVLDIGTGSGILSIASAIVGASSVTALDIRDVKDEVELNASLNGLYNIEVLVGDALSNEVTVKDEYDWIYINIGGEETIMFMDFIKSHLSSNGKILVSGLVTWSYDSMEEKIKNYGFTLLENHQTNEWVTAIFKLNLDV